MAPNMLQDSIMFPLSGRKANEKSMEMDSHELMLLKSLVHANIFMLAGLHSLQCDLML